MFKPLLKTIPSLSGNMKLVCNLEGYTINKENSFVYDCNVNKACLTSISSNLYDKNIPINLLNNSFEYDVKKFYLYYANVFYKTNYNYSQINIPVIDFSSNINNNNSDFKYGCKRVSYLKSGNQLAFFAPIYIEGLDDLKGKYFIIRCTFNKVYKLTKYIKIQISNSGENNKLADYLCRYAEKIDDKVIYCSDSYKNIYYGIDVRNGGFIKVEDNISHNLYNKYFTINDFDATLNNGFKRNYMMMKQIIPLSFYFDPNDLLYDFEKNIYKNAEINISGQWYDENDKEVKFYDFSDDYSIYQEDIYNLYYDNVFKYISTGYNIMDLKYPACNEASSENYKYVNTVAKNYNRWKLKYSNDEYPYIINNNYAFSFNQGSLYTYKEFPIMYSPIRAYAKLVSNTEYNMIFDYNNVYKDDSTIVINNKKKYFELYNNNFISNFFDILVKKDNSEEYLDIFSNIYNYWTDVDKDGKVYHKGVLYDLNTIYNNNLNMDYRIDKFALFVKPRFSYTYARDFNDIYKEAKHVFTYDFSVNNFIQSSQFYNYHNLNTKSSYLLNYKVVIKDDNGPYVDLSRVKKQYEYNIYWDVNDIYILNLVKNNIKIDLNKDIYRKDETNDLKEYHIDLIDGYKIIDVYNISNIYGDYFSELITEFNKNNKRNPDGIIFRNRKFIEIEDIYWAIDKLYFSIYPNKTKYSLVDNYSLLESIKDDNVRIVLYYKTKFVNINDTTKEYLDFLDLTEEYLNRLPKYYYLNGLYDRKNKILYTDKSFKLLNDIDNNYGNLLDEEDNNIIYVDPYNLSDLYNVYIYRNFDPSIQTFKTFKCKFLNLQHIRLYFDKLYKNQDYEGNLSIDNIYIKIRNFNNILIDLNDSENTNFSTINIQDDYINIRDFGLKSLNDIVNYISYDSVLECFEFNNNYKDKIINKYNKWVENNYKYTEKYPENKYKTIFETLDKYSIMHFEVCFEKDMLELPEELYNLIINRKNNAIFKDLYLYHIYDPKDYLCEMNYIDTKKYYIDEKSHKLDNEKLIDYIDNTNRIDRCLYPYFNDVYEEGRTDTKIYSDYFINNIILSYNEIKNRFKYNEPSINFLAYIPKNSNVKDLLTQDELNIVNNIDNEIDQENEIITLSEAKFEGKRYSLVNDVNDSFVTKRDFITYNIVDNPENINEYSNLITYDYNGTYYGFYIINSYFDNTNNTLNIQNEDLDYINCADYINGIRVNMINESSYSYLGEMYKNILPYFSVSNPLKFVVNNIDTLIKPRIYKLKNSIKQYPNVDNDVAYSYTLYNNRKSSTIELSRYFNNIVPYTPEAKYLSSYSIYYKDTNKIIENDLKIKRKPYIMYKEKIDINRFSYVSYFDIDGNVNKYKPTEYKYYNNNHFFNLEKEIIIKLNDYFTEERVIEIENDKDYIFNLFVNYINNDDFDSLPNKDRINNYLFLYKKYEVNFLKDYQHINSQNNKEYSLTIKFKLL